LVGSIEFRAGNASFVFSKPHSQHGPCSCEDLLKGVSEQSLSCAWGCAWDLVRLVLVGGLAALRVRGVRFRGCIRRTRAA